MVRWLEEGSTDGGCRVRNRRWRVRVHGGRCDRISATVALAAARKSRIQATSFDCLVSEHVLLLSVSGTDNGTFVDGERIPAGQSISIHGANVVSLATCPLNLRLLTTQRRVADPPATAKLPGPAAVRQGPHAPSHRAPSSSPTSSTPNASQTPLSPSARSRGTQPQTPPSPPLKRCLVSPSLDDEACSSPRPRDASVSGGDDSDGNGSGNVTPSEKENVHVASAGPSASSSARGTRRGGGGSGGERPQRSVSWSPAIAVVHAVDVIQYPPDYFEATDQVAWRVWERGG